MYRSTTVKTLMKTQFPHINHQADPWHFVKVSHEKQYLEISKTLNLLEHQEETVCCIQVGVREHYWIMAAKCDQPALVGDGKQHR